MNLGALLGAFSGAGPAVAEGMGQMPPEMPQAMPQEMPQAAPQMPTAMPQQRGPNGFQNILGMIGDALLIHSGRAPVYGPTMAQQTKNRAMGTALANYLGNSDAALAEIFTQDPDAGLKLYQMKHPAPEAQPEVIRLMQAAGIDPASDQGRNILTHKLMGDGENDPTFIRELRAMGIEPGSPEARTLFYGKNSPSGYLLTPSGGGADMPTFSTPEEAKASGLPPGTQFRAPNGRVYAIPGGATASPSPTFP